MWIRSLFKIERKCVMSNKEKKKQHPLTDLLTSPEKIEEELKHPTSIAAWVDMKSAPIRAKLKAEAEAKKAKEASEKESTAKDEETGE